jgi:hypothetical protein
MAAECDFGGQPIYSVELPLGVAESPFGAALGTLLARLPTSLSRKPTEEAGADIEPLTTVPKTALLQDGTDYFDLHHTADDTLDKVSAGALDKAVAAWVSFVYLAAETEFDFRAIAAAAAAKPAKP